MKVGIITQYHNSLNYGGNLQAYALYKELQKRGVDAEQICYARTLARHSFKDTVIENLKKGIVPTMKKVWERLNRKNRHVVPVNQEELEVRKSAFYTFSKEMIAHSAKVYNQYDLEQCKDDYDCFITGSDQVWNITYASNPDFFLNFVDGTMKRKFSYAASFSMKELNDEQKKFVKDSLKDYEAISVREQDALTLLDGLTELPVEFVVDPTLLLRREDWDEVCARRVVEEPYIFGYFLGTNIEVVRMAKKFSHKYGKKFVMIPFAPGRYTMDESSLMDERILDASPEKFLSLIKHADYVFTDSFHAVVFSFIYQKQFFVFNRDAKGTMNSRIYSITELFEAEDHFCHSHEMEQISYIEQMSEIDYNREFTRFEELRGKSVEYLERIINA